VTWLILVVVLATLLAAQVTWTAARVDRLHTRVDAARAALDAQLVRRAAAAQALVDRHPDLLGAGPARRLGTAARAALDAEDGVRESAENDLSRALRALPPDLDPALLRDLTDASTRVVLARRFYNDAVRDTRSLRGRWIPRAFRLAGRRPMPTFFEIEEVTPTSPRTAPG
jgi:hypothetical protein